MGASSLSHTGFSVTATSSPTFSRQTSSIHSSPVPYRPKAGCRVFFFSFTSATYVTFVQPKVPFLSRRTYLPSNISSVSLFHLPVPMPRPRRYAVSR